MSENALTLGFKLGGGFLAAVGAIALWSKSREPGWVVIILATLLSYVEVLLTFLEYLGLFPMESYRWNGVSIIRLAFAGGVPFLYGLGFFLVIRSIGK